MLEAAVRGAREEAVRRRLAPPKVLGVTVLTSVGSSACPAAGGASPAVRRRVIALALRAKQAGLDCVIASAQEARAIRRRWGRGLIVCPGIRPAGAAAGDQARVASPAQALADGADWVVIGRPITEARRPRAAAQALMEEMERSC